MYPFGRQIEVTSNRLKIPRALSETKLEEHVKSNLPLMLVFHTIGTDGFDTTKGHVVVWFCQLKQPNGDTHNVVLGHYSLWRMFMVQKYTGWWGAVTKDMMISYLESVTVKGLSVEDHHNLVKVTGTDPLTVPSRIRDEGIFALPVDYFLGVMKLIGKFQFDELFSYCTNHSLNREYLQETMNISSYKMVHSIQSKVSERPFFRTGRNRHIFDELSPTFGIEWSDSQLETLVSVMEHFSGIRITAQHFHSLFMTSSSANKVPMLTRQEIEEIYINGVPNDSDRRPHADRNYARREDRKRLEHFCEERGIPKPKRGRTRNTKRALQERDTINQYIAMTKVTRKTRKKKRKIQRSYWDHAEPSSPPSVTQAKVLKSKPTIKPVLATITSVPVQAKVVIGKPKIVSVPSPLIRHDPKEILPIDYKTKVEEFEVSSEEDEDSEEEDSQQRQMYADPVYHKLQKMMSSLP